LPRRAGAVPVWGWLALLVVASILLRYALGRRMVAPWIMVDELIYSELAKSFAAAGEFRVRGEPSGGYGFVYPVLISPAWALFESVPSAYAFAKAINAVAMSLAAVPAYLLARRFLAEWPSLVVALLTVAVPSMLYTGTLMTENAFYPLFLTAALALVLVLERPSAWRIALLLAVAALAFATRAQAAALAPAIVLAPVLLRGVRAFGEYAALYVTIAAAAVGVAALQIGRGRDLLDLLGAYEVVGDRDYDVDEVAKWLLWHIAELDLYVGVLPFAALLALLFRRRRADRVFLAATVSLTASLIVVVAAFASIPSVQRIEERNMFYVAPLFFIALLVWLERGMPRAWAAAATAALLPVTIPYDRFIGVSAQSDTLMLLPWWWLQDHVLNLDWVRWEVLLACAAFAAAFVLVPRRRAVAFPAVVLAYFAVTAVPIENGRHGLRMASLGALFEGNTTGDRNWVDDAVGADADVGLVWSGRSSVQTVWQNEIFNRSVDAVYHVGSPVPGGLAQRGLGIAVRTGALEGAGRERYVLADVAVPIAGAVVARDERKGMTLYRVQRPLGVTERLTSVYDDAWSQPIFTYTRYRCRGGSVAVTVESDARLFRRAQRVAFFSRAQTGFVEVRPGRRQTLAVPLARERDGRCRVVFAVQPSAVPAKVQAGSDDTRVLGVLVREVEYRA
jgi:hypothetical protein